MDISVVIPLLNEEESLQELHDWIVKVMQSNHFSYEILFVDDGSTDSSWQVIEALAQKNANVKGLKFHRNYGKSQALNVGFKKSKGDVVITMDADLQDSPDEIPELFDLVKNQHYDLISGWKKKRYDSAIRKNLPSKLFNAAARKTSGLSLHDFNCGLKAYRSEVVKNIDVSGEMHRYIPVLAKNAGFSRIEEKGRAASGKKIRNHKIWHEQVYQWIFGPAHHQLSHKIRKKAHAPVRLTRYSPFYHRIFSFCLYRYFKAGKIVPARAGHTGY